jgi:hypothetical protein
MLTGRRISILVILLIIIVLYFFGYNVEYGSSMILYLTLLLLLMFSYIVLTMSTFEKFIGENPKSFILYPMKKIKYIVLTTIYVIILIFLAFSTFLISLGFSENRKNNILNSSETRNIEGLIIKTDSILLKNGKKPVAYLNYKVDDKNYQFELSNQNKKYKLKQKIKLKYSLKHHDMFKIIKES